MELNEVSDEAIAPLDPERPAVFFNAAWRCEQEGAPNSRRTIRLLQDGRIVGYHNGRSRIWRVIDGVLLFSERDGTKTVRFDQAVKSEDGLVLRGHLLPARLDPIVIRLERQAWSKRDELTNLTKIYFANQIARGRCEIGDHTYGQPRLHTGHTAVLKIGRYCSIGPAVDIILGSHRTDLATTYPFTTVNDYWPSTPVGVPDHTDKGDVVIGNDVWIGTGATILSGIKVGDGAVIAAKAMVTKDIPPYAIVVGSPARIARYRFDEATISALLDLRWWDWPDDKVDENLPLLMSDDIHKLIAAHQPAKPTGRIGHTIIVYDGDSITRGAGVAETESYPEQIRRRMERPAVHRNVGLNGASLRVKLTTLDRSLHGAAYDATAERFIVVVGLGTNDLCNPVNAVPIYLAMRDYIRRLKSFGDNVRVVLCTLLDRTDRTSSQRSQVSAFNEMLRASWSRHDDYGLGADGLADLARDGILGAVSAASDKSLFYDGVHPTAFGCSRIAAIVGPQIDLLLS